MSWMLILKFDCMFNTTKQSSIFTETTSVLQCCHLVGLGVLVNVVADGLAGALQTTEGTLRFLKKGTKISR